MLQRCGYYRRAGDAHLNMLNTIGRSADVLLIALLLFQCLLGLRLFHTISLYLRHRRRGLAHERAMLALPLPADDALPAVLVQIPCYNEGALVRRALAAAVGLDWPRDRLHIQLLDDSTDVSRELAREIVAEFQAAGHPVVLLQRTNRAGFKAGALRAGLDCSNEPFIAMFDADYVPEPDFLRRCMPPLIHDPQLAFVQARCDFLNAFASWLTRAQQVMLESHFAVEQPARSWSGRILPFNGTCGIWRRAAIVAAGGWQADTLTEDLDLSYRAQLLGWNALYLVSVAVPGELPESLPVWRNQQFRWNKGFAQAALKLLPKIWRQRLPRGLKVDSSLHLGGPSFAVVKLLETPLWVIDIGLGTCSYAVLLSILAFGIAQGVSGALLMAWISRSLLRPFRSFNNEPRPLQMLVSSLHTLVLHVYIGSVTARGTWQALCGYNSIFVRTPKRGAMADLRGGTLPD
jgi:cellulose synthase/poly-beta-1,6-N-acetylglucosamine synthase-like glycosyltransferase